MDKVDLDTRSRTMAAVRSRGNRSTEWRLRPYLIQAGFKGWKVQSCDLPGKPDFVFPIERVAIFVDGCFWHGCPRCLRMPRTNKKYWKDKIARNIERDKINLKKLRALNWKVIRFWEHQLKKSPTKCIKRIHLIVNDLECH